MTRPPSAPGFAQFFPTAPKVRAEAEGRGHRERSSSRTNGVVDSSRDDPAHADARPQLNGAAASPSGRVSSVAPQAHTRPRVDENEPSADIPGTGDSGSSHGSTVSSVLSARPATTSASSRYPTASSTPLTSKDSPASLPAAGYSRPEMPASAAPGDDAARHAPKPSPTPVSRGLVSDSTPSAIDALPARDPTPSVKGVKCTFDPLLERLRNKAVSRSAKPVYKEFGLVRIT